jgi:hypothetical protein
MRLKFATIATLQLSSVRQQTARQSVIWYPSLTRPGCIHSQPGSFPGRTGGGFGLRKANAEWGIYVRC